MTVEQATKSGPGKISMSGNNNTRKKLPDLLYSLCNIIYTYTNTSIRKVANSIIFYSIILFVQNPYKTLILASFLI